MLSLQKKSKKNFMYVLRRLTNKSKKYKTNHKKYKTKHKK